ncbi:hypothetical protein Hanom_Chr03g00226221 [Helianthus anomalus]
MIQPDRATIVEIVFCLVKAEMVYGFAARVRENVKKSLVKTSGIVWGLDKDIQLPG